MKKLSSRKLIIFVTIVLTAMPLISLPQVFDGISYIKVFVALICITPLVPILFKDIFEDAGGVILKILLTAMVLTIFLIIYLIPSDYRGIFGAPGRHNGSLTLLLYIYFTLFGIYVYKKKAISIVLNGLMIASSLTCTISFINSVFQNFKIFPSVSYANSSFYDNVDNIAPLVSMALTASIVLFFKSKNILYLVFQMPGLYFILKWEILQSIVTIVASVGVYFLVNKKPKFRLFALIPLFILIAYVSIISVLPRTPLVNDSSILERYRIIIFAKEIFKTFSFFPIRIDALSDFSTDFNGITPNQYLDDFHNVFLQMFYSFGLLIGLAIASLFILPFILRTWKFSESPITFPIYFNFFVGLIFGIASSNYMYFGCLFIGHLIGASLPNRRIALTRFKSSASVSCLIVLVTVPAFLQIYDFGQRLEVSTQSRAYTPGLSNDRYFENLVKSVSDVRDADYKFQVARNLYAIGECSFGDQVFQQMFELNPREVRNNLLLKLKDSCR
jgi:hypothetical protein